MLGSDAKGGFKFDICFESTKCPTNVAVEPHFLNVIVKYVLDISDWCMSNLIVFIKLNY